MPGKYGLIREFAQLLPSANSATIDANPKQCRRR